MDPSALAVFLFLGVPLVGGFFYLFYAAWARHTERKIQLMNARPARLDDSAYRDLLKEIRNVGQVANEYDLSIQHKLEQIEKRLLALETSQSAVRSAPTPAVHAPSSEQRLTAGLGGAKEL